MHAYANDYNGRFPIPARWFDLLSEHAQVAPEAFRCRGRDEDGRKRDESERAGGENRRRFAAPRGPPHILSVCRFPDH